MANSKSVTAVKTQQPAAGIPRYTLSDVDEMEKKALEKANKAISAIENALAVWDASTNKSEELRPRINRLRYFHDALSGWEKKLLTSMTQKGDVSVRIETLREFSDICHAYGQ